MYKSMSFEQCLEEQGSLTYHIKGVSMLPMLKQGCDIFTAVKKCEERCRKYDVVLYRRPPDQYVLHRIIEVRADSYVILGDNCIAKEYNIHDDDIIAVMTSFTHNGRNIQVTNHFYQIYSRIWVALHPVRVFLKRVKAKLFR